MPSPASHPQVGFDPFSGFGSFYAHHLTDLTSSTGRLLTIDDVLTDTQGEKGVYFVRVPAAAAAAPSLQDDKISRYCYTRPLLDQWGPPARHQPAATCSRPLEGDSSGDPATTNTQDVPGMSRTFPVVSSVSSVPVQSQRVSISAFPLSRDRLVTLITVVPGSAGGTVLAFAPVLPPSGTALLPRAGSFLYRVHFPVRRYLHLRFFVFRF
jgi:hypothetical protein